jgi:hypothetical protein
LDVVADGTDVRHRDDAMLKPPPVEITQEFGELRLRPSDIERADQVDDPVPAIPVSLRNLSHNDSWR